MTIAEYEALYEANIPYTGDATKQANALQALMGLRMKRAQSMGGAGHQLAFAALDQEISLLEKMVATSNSGSFTKARMLNT